MVAAARVSKGELLTKFDPGVPQYIHATNRTRPREMDAIMFYSHADAEPDTLQHNFDLQTVEKATSNCKAVELILRHDPSEHTCFAIVGNRESQGSPTVFRWVRSNNKDDSSFERVGRGREQYMDDDELPLPQPPVSRKHRKQLASYLSILDDVLIPYVRPILDGVVHHEYGLVVSAVHAGHADLLQNFVCSCRANDFDLAGLVVFCMDTESQRIARDLGLTTIYHPDLFGAIPSKHAESFGDETFQMIVYSKVIVPHLLSVMGYSFLYQDVDVVWYKNPLTYLKEHGFTRRFDLLFQDDGSVGYSRDTIYAPYCANSGFYYVNDNAKTQYFFRQVLYNADSIPGWYSEQPVFNAILPQAASSFGLAVKILPQRDFPGGHFYQFSLPLMKRIMKKEHQPVMFHMHFTVNKAQKILQMKQSGMWYLTSNSSSSEYTCSHEPVIECFHWDRPSVPACRKDDSMTKFDEEEDGERFWYSDDE